jgi:phosphoribosylformylglycinamidine synthase
VIGVVEELVAAPPSTVAPGDALVLLGARRAPGSRAYPLAGTAWAARRGRRGGALPTLDTAAHQRVCSLVVDLVEPSLRGEEVALSSVHDVSSGGIGVALAELCLRHGVGASVNGIDGHAELFTEVPSRFLVTTANPDAVAFAAQAGGVPVAVLGTMRGDRLVVDGLCGLDLGDLRSSSDRLGLAASGVH